MLNTAKLLVTALLVSSALDVFAGKCSDYDVSTCQDHEGCVTCEIVLPVIDVKFCLETSTAEKLPGGLFNCGDDILPDVRMITASKMKEQPLTASLNTLTADECSDLGHKDCEKHSACAWCESAAVPSACYTVQQAKRLPAAVFKCEIPTLTNLLHS